MKLEKIFGKGHKLACSRDPALHVVLTEATEELPPGYYYLESSAVEVMAIKRGVDRALLGARLGIPDLVKEIVWFPDVDHCWCESCAETRQFRGTLSD